MGVHLHTVRVRFLPAQPHLSSAASLSQRTISTTSSNDVGCIPLSHGGSHHNIRRRCSNHRHSVTDEMEATDDPYLGQGFEVNTDS